MGTTAIALKGAFLGQCLCVIDALLYYTKSGTIHISNWIGQDITIRDCTIRIQIQIFLILITG